MHSLDGAELGTILAALRYWQTASHHQHPRIGQEEAALLDNIATADGTIHPLTDAEIDDLCERLNCEPDGLGPIAVVIDGGSLQDVVTHDKRLHGVKVVLVDYDTDGSEDADDVLQGSDGTTERAFLGGETIEFSMGIDVPELASRIFLAECDSTGARVDGCSEKPIV